MKRKSEARKSSIRDGRLSMSSRWISISLRRSAGLRSRLMVACAAFTSDDLPMPRAPHSSALLAGSPLAKRSVFSIRMSRIRSMPLSSISSTRLTRPTVLKRPLGCQTKASASAKENGCCLGGRLSERWAAMASSAVAILEALSSGLEAGGRFAGNLAAFFATALRAVAETDLRVIFDILNFPDRGGFIEPFQRLQAAPNQGWVALQLG